MPFNSGDPPGDAEGPAGPGEAGELGQLQDGRDLRQGRPGTNCIKIGLLGKLILSKRKGLREVLFP